MTKPKITYQLETIDGEKLHGPGPRSKMMALAASYGGKPIWLAQCHGGVCLLIEELWCGKPAPSSSQFRALIRYIIPDDLRVRVEDSAIGNARDTMVERGLPTNEGCAFWEVAIDTAKMIIDDPRAYYPELYE